MTGRSTVEKISKFLKQHGPHFDFDSGSFTYSVPKSMSEEGSSWVMGETESMQSTDMKYQFKKIFLLSIK